MAVLGGSRAARCGEVRAALPSAPTSRVGEAITGDLALDRCIGDGYVVCGCCAGYASDQPLNRPSDESGCVCLPVGWSPADDHALGQERNSECGDECDPEADRSDFSVHRLADSVGSPDRSVLLVPVDNSAVVRGDGWRWQSGAERDSDAGSELAVRAELRSRAGGWIRAPPAA
jgi:hypothetical protein